MEKKKKIKPGNYLIPSTTWAYNCGWQKEMFRYKIIYCKDKMVKIEDIKDKESANYGYYFIKDNFKIIEPTKAARILYEK